MPISSVNPADSPPPRSSVARKPRRDGRLPVSDGIRVTWPWRGPKLVTRSMAKSIRPYTVTEDWADTPAHVASRLALTMNLHGAFISSPERIIKFFRPMRRDWARGYAGAPLTYSIHWRRRHNDAISRRHDAISGYRVVLY